jgi:hypothetical protein
LLLLLTSRIVFFLDQCLSGDALPRAVVEFSGYPVQKHRNNFPVTAKDPEWLLPIGRRGWILITKDWQIQERPLLREAILNAGVRAFVFRETRLKGEVMIAILKHAMPKMLSAINHYAAPFIFALEADGQLTPISNLEELDPK